MFLILKCDNGEDEEHQLG